MIALSFRSLRLKCQTRKTIGSPGNRVRNFCASNSWICGSNENIGGAPKLFPHWDRRCFFLLSARSCQTNKRGEADQPLSDARELFDEYAKSYELALSNALAPSGENREYFAEGRIRWLKRCLSTLAENPMTVLDFGCGDGSTTPLLQRGLNAESCLGVDVSAKSLQLAKEHFATDQIHYQLIEDLRSEAQFDLAYCNGVFHHIPLAARVDAAGIIRNSLKPGGLFSFWENNAWNLATHYVMSRCPFDKEAILVSPLEARTLLKQAGFEILRTDFRFIFPRALRGLRRIEDVVYKLPLGAQYQVLCRRPN